VITYASFLLRLLTICYSERFQVQKDSDKRKQSCKLVTLVICAFLILEGRPENNFNSSSYWKWSIDIICLGEERMPLHCTISISHTVYGHTVVLDSNVSTEFLTNLAWCCGWRKFPIPWLPIPGQTVVNCLAFTSNRSCNYQKNLKCF